MNPSLFEADRSAQGTAAWLCAVTRAAQGTRRRLLLLAGAFTHKFTLVRDHEKPLSWQENMNRELGNREKEKGLTGQWSWRVEAGERPHVGGACARAEGAGQTEQPRASGRGGDAPRVFVAAVSRRGCSRTGAGSERRRWPVPSRPSTAAFRGTARWCP